ncbi:unnamed protein product [Blepharisma stoltei]|uniref:C2H2-type domain-containing protein n=1 Tax=Blepharisma stoltei TaxID=1481888 RepID=A0AAU9JH04_9CILI|nr:unnamed protein product [Blepharisma stoltei]
MDLPQVKEEDIPVSFNHTAQAFSKDRITLNGINFALVVQDRYKCESCSQIMNFVLVPAHTKSHTKPISTVPTKPRGAPPMHTESLEFEDSKRSSNGINKGKNSQKKSKKASFPKIGPENDGEYCSSDTQSFSASASEDFPEPPASDSASQEEVEDDIKSFDNKENFSSCDDDSMSSSSGDSTMNHHTIETMVREKGVKGYRCMCDACFYTYRKFKAHTNVKKAGCPRCGEIFYCRNVMKKHHIECLKRKCRIKYDRKEKIPNPKYLRGIEEAVRKMHAIYEENYKPPNEDEMYKDYGMPIKSKRRYE